MNKLAMNNKVATEPKKIEATRNAKSKTLTGVICSCSPCLPTPITAFIASFIKIYMN